MRGDAPDKPNCRRRVGWVLQVSLAGKGGQACQRSAAEAGAFDLVLLDVRLSLRKPVDIARLRKTIADALNRR